MEIEDPALWLRAARVICDRLRLRPERCIPLGVALELVSVALLEEAGKQGRGEVEVLDALRDLAGAVGCKPTRDS